MMQAIAGMHYNFSMPDSFWPVWLQIKVDQQPLQDFISESYLGLIHNFFDLAEVARLFDKADQGGIELNDRLSGVRH